MMIGASSTTPNPYVGPRAFEEGETQLFFGRDEETEILAGLVMTRRTVLFFAQSGAGKTSLLRAGLIPELTQQKTIGRGRRVRTYQKARVLPIMTVGGGIPSGMSQPIANIYTFSALLSLLPDTVPDDLAGLTLLDGLAPFLGANVRETVGADLVPATTAPADMPALLVFDQFEELFTHHPTHWLEREDFFRQVNQALDKYPTLHVLFTMREDYIAQLTPYANLLREQLRSRFRLERLQREAAFQAVKQPAARAGRPFAEGVAEKLVEDLLKIRVESAAGETVLVRGEFVEPVQLQLVCESLWRDLPPEATHITADHIRVFGDVNQALSRFYDRSVKEAARKTDVTEADLRAWFEQRLITPAGTRGTVYRGAEETGGIPNAAVDELEDLHVIRGEWRAGARWYELTHDRFIEPIQESNSREKRNLSRVIGVRTEAVQGAVYGGDIYEVQVYALRDAGREANWRRFLEENTPPYKGLSPYTARDRALFKGRDTEIMQVVRQIGEQRLLVVYGQAGVGATSLLAAGVIPNLVENGALVVRVQDYHQPVVDIRAALAANTEQLPIPLPAEVTLPALVRAVTEETQGTLVLILDQFERLFELPAAHRKAFIGELGDSLQAAEPDLLRLVIAVHEDALRRLFELQNDLPGLLDAPVQLLPLSHRQAKSAIEGPLTELAYPVGYVGDLVDSVLVPDLDELTPEEPGQIFPTHLQIVCDWLYRAARMRHPPLITTELYFTANGVDGIMARYMAETLTTQLAGDRLLATRVLIAMAAPDVGRWVSPKDLQKDLQEMDASPEQLLNVLERLVEAELLVRRAVEGRSEYAFANHTVAREAARLGGREVERLYQAQNELELIWSAWLARDALATRGQLRYLADAGKHLSLRPVETLILLGSAVARDEPTGPWLAWLRTDEGRGLIRQLEETDAPDLTHRSSRSTLNQAELLLGLHEVTLPNRPGNGGQPCGTVAWSAVRHPNSITRQTAALALTAMGSHEALHRLEWALRTGLQGWQRLRRRAEVRGALAAADSEIEQLNADLPPLDRAWVWQWRARRHLVRNRYRIAALTLGGAIGAGLSLGFLRGALAVLAPYTRAGIQFSIYFLWATILGAAVSSGMTMAEHLLVNRSEEASEIPSTWRVPLRPDRPPTVLATALGTLFFGIAHITVALLNGLSLSRAPLIVTMGFVAGLGLSMALYAQPRAGWHLGFGRWLLRLGAATLSFTLTQWIFIIAGDKGTSIAIVWPGSFYKAEFYEFVMTRWPQLIDAYPQWSDYLALSDAALVGIVLTIGITVGLAMADDWVGRWRTLVNRAGD